MTTIRTTIRIATIEDLSSISALMQDCNLKYNLGIQDSCRLQDTLKSFIEVSRIHLLLNNDLIVGYVIVQDYTTLFDVYELGIISMYIREDSIHLIRHMLSFIKREALDHQVDCIRIQTDLGFIDERFMKLLTLKGYKTIGFSSLYTF